MRKVTRPAVFGRSRESDLAIGLGKQVRYCRESLEGNGALRVRQGIEVSAVKPMSIYLLALGHDPAVKRGNVRQWDSATY